MTGNVENNILMVYFIDVNCVYWTFSSGCCVGFSVYLQCKRKMLVHSLSCADVKLCSCLLHVCLDNNVHLRGSCSIVLTASIKFSSDWLPGEWPDKESDYNHLLTTCFSCKEIGSKTCLCLFSVHCWTFLYLWGSAVSCS